MAAPARSSSRRSQSSSRRSRRTSARRSSTQVAERFIRSRGAVPTFKGYRGFPGSICASPNAMVVHGIPGPSA